MDALATAGVLYSLGICTLAPPHHSQNLNKMHRAQPTIPAVESLKTDRSINENYFLAARKLTSKFHMALGQLLTVRVQNGFNQ